MAEGTAARSEASGPGTLIDIKGLGKPPTFNNTEAAFLGWNRKTENYIIGAFGEEFRKVLQWSVDEAKAIQMIRITLPIKMVVIPIIIIIIIILIMTTIIVAIIMGVDTPKPFGLSVPTAVPVITNVRTLRHNGCGTNSNTLPLPSLVPESRTLEVDGTR